MEPTPLTSLHPTVMVVTGGDPMEPARLEATAALLPVGATVIAADSGIDQARRLGWPVHLAVGDFDSVSAVGLEAVTAAGARIERHPVAKDATDLELALDAALTLDPEEIIVVGGHGGRLDHLLAGVLLLAGDAYAGVRIRAVMGDASVDVIRSRLELTGAVGQLMTLLAVGGPARGVTTEGLAYPLRDETLEPGSSRGVSNVLVADRVVIAVTSGVLLAIRPSDPSPADPSPADPSPADPSDP
jgi:thiamine pyrophosphokinase